jgi:MOSC domain-containing protein YiiM
MTGKIHSINIAEKKKGGKTQIKSGKLIKDIGLEGDAYNKPDDRQISITSIELIEEQNFCPRVRTEDNLISGDFSETITTSGIDLSKISVGDKFKVGETAEIEISQIGMTCFKFCPIGKVKNECPLPKYFLFAKVLESGNIETNNSIAKF